METVLISDYDTAWPRRFEEYAVALHRALGQRAIRIDHIGSTSADTWASDAAWTAGLRDA